MIPPMVEGKPVTEIAKKAALSCKALRELFLPDTIETVGEWAVAHCSNLRAVHLPQNELYFGKGAFKECLQLGRIYAGEEKEEKTAALLASVPVMLEAEYLLSPLEAGEAGWLEKLDARLMSLMEKPDREGYSKQILCGEEDLMASLDLYLLERIKQKARLCYLRLLNDTGLKEEVRSYLTAWLKAHTKGCESQAAWEVVWQEHGNEKPYYEAFAQAGCIREENFDGLLSDLSKEHPEMKAWLLRYREEHMAKTDFFDSLSLDF